MNKKTILIIASIVGVLMLCACVAVAGLVGFNLMRADVTTLITPEAPVVEVTQVVDVLPATPQPAEPEPLPTAKPPVQPQGSPSNDDFDRAERVANTLLWHLADHEYDQAVELTDSTLRGDSGTAGQLRGLVEDKGLEPSIWEWTSQNSDAGRIQMDGVMNLADARRGYVSVELSLEDGDWKVNYLDLKTEGDSSDPGPLSEWTAERTEEELAFARGTANIFIQDWQAGDFENAYILTSQPMKDEVGGAEQIEAILGGLGVLPADWTWDNWVMKELEGHERPVIELQGSMNYQSGHSGPVIVQLLWEDGYWSVLYIDVKAE